METSAVAPHNLLDPKAKAAWRVQNAIGAAPLLVLGAAATSALAYLEMGIVIAVLPLLAAVGLAVLWVTVVPAVRYRRWRWQVADEEIRLQRGIIIIERTVVPMVRVQHVDTSQGPILGAFGLSEVRVWTAAGVHAIPALADKDAAELRDRIARLARVTDDGGL